MRNNSTSVLDITDDCLGLPWIIDSSCKYKRGHTIRPERGVPTERGFYTMGLSIGIERNNLKPSHSGNTYPVRFRAFFRCIQTTEMSCDGFRPIYRHAITFDKGFGCHSTRIDLFYFDNTFSRIMLWVSAVRLKDKTH